MNTWGCQQLYCQQQQFRLYAIPSFWLCPFLSECKFHFGAASIRQPFGKQYSNSAIDITGNDLFCEIESQERNSPTPLLVADQQQVIEGKNKKLPTYFDI